MIAMESFFPILFCLLVVSFPGIDARAQNKSKLIGKIQNSKLVEGCGCEFQSTSREGHRNGPYVLLSGLQETAWVNINGRDTKLKLVKTIQRPRNEKRVDRKGDKTVEEYEGGGVRATISRTVTRPCPANDESCEYVGMVGIIRVSIGSRKQQIKIVGGCGC